MTVTRIALSRDFLFLVFLDFIERFIRREVRTVVGAAPSATGRAHPPGVKLQGSTNMQAAAG